MDALKKGVIIQFIRYQTTTLPKWMFSQKRCDKSSLLINYSDNLCLLFCLYPFSIGQNQCCGVGAALITIYYFGWVPSIEEG